MGPGGYPRPETPAGPAGTGQVRKEPGQVPGSWRCSEAGGPMRARAGPVPGAPVGRWILLGLQTFLKSVLHGHRGIFALHRASFGPCHAVFSTLFLTPGLFYVLAFPRLPGRATKVWWACSFSRSCWICSFSPLRLALAQMPEWAGKAHLGPRSQRSLLPLLFWCFSCCHFRSHSCSENIVADTQQDDLLAVIHGESSQTGFFPPLMINLCIKLETQ